MSEGWEDRAAAWIAFARTPGHDAYWAYRERFFDLLPRAAARVLEVGCGEGRVCRDLRARGYDPVGLDASPSLVAAARAADPAGRYVVGPAEELPFDDRSLDLAVTYNSLMDVADLGRTLSEIGRTLAPGGSHCACVVHPLADLGAFAAIDDVERFVVERSYFDESAYEVPSDRNGIRFTFATRRYTVASYLNAVADAGLVLSEVAEPRVPAGDEREPRWGRLPMFLMWRATKPT